MPKEDRKRMILGYLDEKNVMLPPKVLYDNLAEYRHATFSKRTVERHLEEAEEEGLVEIVQKGNPYYRITDRGRAYVADEQADDEASG